MGLAAPWFLAGLAALALPVWLHLLKRHRSTPLPFASLMFFERRTQSSVKHRRLRYLLLFGLRTALLALLALAFARPYLTRQTAAVAGPRQLVVAIDNSFSMRQGGRLARAKREAEALIASRPDAQVLAFSSGVQEMGEGSAAVRTIEAGDGRGSFVELARALRAIGARTPVEAHVFSDMQRTSLAANFTDMALGPEVMLAPHRVAPERAANFAVESVKAPRHVYGDGHLRVEVTLAGYGAEKAVRRAMLVVNGRQVETRQAEIPAGGRATVEFNGVEAAHGANRCEVLMEPADHFPEDDRFWFAVDRAQSLPVLFVHEGADSRALLYVRAALEAAGQSAFRLDAATLRQHPDPARYGMVVLSDAPVPADFEAVLKEYVNNGGGVLVTLGRAIAARRRVPLLDTAVVGLVETAQSGQPGFGGQARFYQSVRVDAGDARVSARLADGTPLVFEKQMGAGRVMVFASAFDNRANDFPLHAGFVPFIFEAARRLGGLEDAPAAQPVDTFLRLRAGHARGETLEALDPSGARVLSLDEATRAEGIRLARTGFYDVSRAGGRREIVAVNPDRRESDLEGIPAETLELWRNTGGAAAAPRGATGAGQPRRVEFWWYLALVAVVLTLAESVVGNLHLREGATGREGERAKAKEAA